MWNTVPFFMTCYGNVCKRTVRGLGEGQDETSWAADDRNTTYQHPVADAGDLTFRSLTMYQDATPFNAEMASFQTPSYP